MKTQILAGTLGLVLLLSIVPLQPAEANVFLVDDFSNDGANSEVDADQPKNTCDISLSAAISLTAESKVTLFNSTVLGVLGDWRLCTNTVNTANPPDVDVIKVVAFNGTGDPFPYANMFRHEGGNGVISAAMLEYKGFNIAESKGSGLDLNLLNSDDLQVQYSNADQIVNVTARITDTGGDWAEQEGELMEVTNTNTNLNFDLDTFVTGPSDSVGTLDLDHIAKIKLTFEDNVAFTDYTLEHITITMQMVGGEMFPVDTTALILAGAELNAIWILPAIAAIGIGAFVVSRKRS